MKHTEIEAIFTAKVAEYLANGYTINPGTMAGSQGEIAKVDVKRGNEIIRILLATDAKYGKHHREMIKLVIGRNTDELHGHPFDTFGRTIWNNNLEIIEEREFYYPKHGADYYTEDAAEIDAITEKQMNRYRNRSRDITIVFTDNRAKEIARKFMRRQPKCSRISVNQIENITKRIYDGRAHYSVTLNNRKQYRLA